MKRILTFTFLLFTSLLTFSQMRFREEKDLLQDNHKINSLKLTSVSQSPPLLIGLGTLCIITGFAISDKYNNSRANGVNISVPNKSKVLLGLGGLSFIVGFAIEIKEF